MMPWLDEITAFVSVVITDVALAGDNAVVVGMAAAGLPPLLRRRAILIGIGAATVLRVVFAVFTAQLLKVVGLTFAGGILLLWVAWKLWRELRAHAEGTKDDQAAAGKSLSDAVRQIVIADISMSLDNVLGVAGAARDHPTILVFGLVLSVGLMGLGANLIATLLEKHRWISYVGLVVILGVAMSMVYEGGPPLWAAVAPGTNFAP